MLRVFVSSLAFAALLAAASAGEISREELKFQTDDGAEISAYFVKGSREAGPAVILLHDSGGSKEDWLPVLEEHLLPRTAYSYLAVDLRGHGKSTGKGGQAVSREEFGEQDYRDMSQDVAAAAGYLAARGDIDAGRIAVMGAGLGANTALLFATKRPDVKVVALVSPDHDHAAVMTKDFVQRYGRRPIFVAVASEDAAGKKAAGFIATTVSGLKVMRRYPGNIRGTRMFQLYPVYKPVVEFLEEYLE